MAVQMVEEAEERQNLGLLCYYPARAMEFRVFAALADAGFTDLTIAQGRVAARIGPAGTRVTELAEQAGITKQTAGYLVDQLERAGYVRRVPDPTDARARLVQLADRGAAVREVARPPKPGWRPSGARTSAPEPANSSVVRSPGSARSPTPTSTTRLGRRGLVRADP
jgi:DNA-binding MarR family transcriptional regulator